VSATYADDKIYSAAPLRSPPHCLCHHCAASPVAAPPILAIVPSVLSPIVLLVVAPPFAAASLVRSPSSFLAAAPP